MVSHVSFRDRFAKSTSLEAETYLFLYVFVIYMFLEKIGRILKVHELLV